MADLAELKPEFATKVDQLLTNCQSRGVVMRPFFTIRTPLEQAKLWRQSRSTEEINAQVASLRKQGASYLAQCIVDVGPCNGPQVTNAIPGLSWHQWREAVDCFWFVNGKAEWDYTKNIKGINGYKIYVEEAKKLGLTPLGPSIGDWVHVQMRKESSPQRLYKINEIDQMLKEMWG